MIPLAALALAGCLALNFPSDRITAGDLAPVFPGMETVDAPTPLAFTPAPGASRVFRVPELARLAERFQLTPPRAPICVTRPVAPLKRDQILAAMRGVFPNGQISLLDWSRAPVPAGDLTFPAGQLRSGPAGQWWSGYVSYGGSHRFTVWARVSVQIPGSRVVALYDLPSGQPIGADAIVVETRQCLPGAEDFAVSIDQVAGKLPHMPIPAGTPVRLHQVAKPLEIKPGDIVQVDVESGATHLEFEARAEGSGAVGDSVPLTNLASHRRFTARVIGKGRVSVDSSVR